MINRCKSNPCCGDQTYCTEIDRMPVEFKTGGEIEKERLAKKKIRKELFQSILDEMVATADNLSPSNHYPANLINDWATRLKELP